MYEDWVERMYQAKTAAERSATVTDMARVSGRSVDWVYRTLRDLGWVSGRKRRADAGTTAQDETVLRTLASVQVESIRKNGKETMPLSVARSILQQNGMDFQVSDPRLRTLLKEMKLDRKSMKTPTPAQRLRTEYPNQVHQADPSLCLIYYAPDGGQVVIHDDEAYKNKPFMEGKEHLKCWRYVLTDHYSGSICVRYYQSKGESSANMYDFLMYAWGQKENELYAFHGLPDLLVWDCGSANTAKALSRALASLRVETKPHLPGNPRAKGQVESSNNLVECHLESRLRFEPVQSVDELNDLADRWCASFNADQIQGLSCQITRMGRKMGSRTGLWRHIQADQLRELPNPEVCRLLLTSEPTVRKVDGNLAISYAHPKAGRQVYSLHGQQVTVGMEVEVQPILVSETPTVAVRWMVDRDPVAVELEPIETDAAGFDIDAAVIGKQYKRPADTTMDADRKELKKAAYGTLEPKRDAVPFASANDGQGLKAHSFLTGKAAWEVGPAPVVGTRVEVTSADVVRPEELTYTATEAVKKIRARVLILPDGYLAKIKHDYPDGVPYSHIEDLAHEILASTKTTKLFKEA